VEVPPLAIVIGLFLLLGGAGFFFLNRKASQTPPPPPPPTQAARDYVPNLKLSSVEMNAHTSYLNQQVVEITGSLTNTGNRKLALVEVNCIFYDGYRQLVLNERVPVISRKMGGLAPGETKQFRLPFDNIPESWNQAMPAMVIAQVQFQ
jgi:LPXTG-motif cell wall-anchored protein